MVDFLVALLVVTFAVAAAMEVFKTILNSIGVAVMKRKGKPFSVSPHIWWIVGGILSILGTFFAWKAVLGSEEPMTPLLSVLASSWMLWAWCPLVWYVQMQFDMKVLKAYAIPIIKKLLAKKAGIEDA